MILSPHPKPTPNAWKAPAENGAALEAGSLQDNTQHSMNSSQSMNKDLKS